MAGAYRPDVTAIPLGRPSPGASSNQPERQGQRTRPRGRTRASLLFGFAPGGACRAADVAAGAVRSYRTLSPLPRRTSSVASGRFAFCGAFPGVAPAGRYPAPRPYGARTFLRSSKRRPSGRLADEGHRSGDAPAVKRKEKADEQRVARAQSEKSTRRPRSRRDESWRSIRSLRWRPCPGTIRSLSGAA